MLKLWRPDRVEWGNRWGVEDDLNRMTAEGWTLLSVLPADPWSGEVPTFVLQNGQRWKNRFLMAWYWVLYWRLRNAMKKWWPRHA